VNRTDGQRGYCGETSVIRAARAALHFWEEPCISGSSGSGTVFFTGCSLGCVYCQNRAISRGEAGKEITVERLAHIFLELQEKGANNINLVTPTHFILQIRDALLLAKEEGLSLPVVYNTSGYEKVEALRLLDGLVDIYLPDLKYYSPELSARYSGCSDYFAVADKAVREMFRQVGKPVFASAPGDDSYSDDNLLMRGVIVRHLLLPGCLEESKRVLSYLHDSYGDSIIISIMSQYTPYCVEDYPELNRRVTGAEYDALVEYAVSIGIEQAFIQGEDVDNESFIPAFDGEGLQGN